MNPPQDEPARFHPTRRLVIVLSIILLAILLPIAVVAIVLTMAWQTSPEKALADAITYARTSPAVYQVTGGTDAVTIRYDGTRLAAGGTYDAIAFDSVIDGKTGYIKTPTPEKLITKVMAGATPVTLQPLVSTVVKLVTNRWVSVSLDQLPFSGSPGTNTTSCALDANEELSVNANAAGELAQTYMQHSFMHIATTKSGDAATYAVTFDENKIKSFWDALEKTQYFQSLSTDCADIMQTLRGIPVGQMSLRVTLDNKAHTLKTADVTLPNKRQLHIAATYGAKPMITVPTDALAYDSITNSIWQSLFNLKLKAN